MKSKTPCIFVTGTDTGVGKTRVATLLTTLLRFHHLQVLALKPIETGCTMLSDGTAFAADADLLHKAAAAESSIDSICFYRFPLPVAPLVAAQEARRAIDWNVLVQKIEQAKEQADIVIVEGAGGLLVPITLEKTFADLAKEIEAYGIVVVGSKLGALNHSLLTFEVLHQKKIPLLGYVLNDLFASPHANDSSLASNRDVIAQLANRQNIKEIGYLPFEEQKSLDSKDTIENTEKGLGAAVAAILELCNSSR